MQTSIITINAFEFEIQKAATSNTVNQGITNAANFTNIFTSKKSMFVHKPVKYAVTAAM